MNLTKVNRLVQRLERSRTALYLLCFVFLLLVAGGVMAATGCSPPKPVVNRGKSSHKRTSSLTGAEPSLANAAHVAAQGQYAEMWLEFGTTGIFTPTTARGPSLSTPYGETPPIEDELAEKGYIAIRVPHAPPMYTTSSLVPGIPPGEPDAVVFSYYAPPDSTTLITVPVSITRRTEYEPIVNARFPIEDGQSHWEVWWLPEGERFPIPDQPFRLDAESWPPPLGLRFRIDFVDADPFACAGCLVGELFYNGYVFIGPYDFAIRYTYPTVPREPLVTFGAHCGYESKALFPTVWQCITPTVPFTHVHCLENWDTVTRIFTITTTSSQGWDYTHYYKTTEPGAVPVPVPGVPFTVTVGPPPGPWSPGLLGFLAAHTPTIAVTDTMRETFIITATSTVSPEVQAAAYSFALAPSYQLDEDAAPSTADLSIGKVASSDAITAGERITYTIIITNAGPTTPATATVVDTFSDPAALAGVTFDGNCAWPSGSPIVTCTVTGVVSGTPAHLRLVVTTSDTYSGTLNNTGVVTPTGDVIDSDIGNNNAGPVEVIVRGVKGAVAFSAATYSVSEGAGTAAISVTLDAASANTVTVDYATSDGTATGGSDYITASGTVTFTAGTTMTTFAVAITDDALDENDETVALALSDPGNGTLGTPVSATLTIVDDDPEPTVQFSAATYSVDEDAGTATISVTLDAASGKTVTVDYATSDGTATGGSDYTATSGTVTFTAGTTMTTFPVAITGDTLDENDETAALALSDPDNGTLGTPVSATLTIVDDDPEPTVQFSTATYSVDEDAGTAAISVTLDAASGKTVAVNYATSDGTATGGSDYTATSGTVTFTAGTTVMTFPVAITDDALDEDDETVALVLSDPDNGTLGTPVSATLTIVDDDSEPTVQFSAATYSVDEDAGTATISVTLDAASGKTVTVDYATSDGTATGGSDYTAISDTLTFNPGEIIRIFSVPILDDTLKEPNETVELALSSPGNGTLGTPTTAMLTILDDDPFQVYLPMALRNSQSGAMQHPASFGKKGNEDYSAWRLQHWAE